MLHFGLQCIDFIENGLSSLGFFDKCSPQFIDLLLEFLVLLLQRFVRLNLLMVLCNLMLDLLLEFECVLLNWRDVAIGGCVCVCTDQRFLMRW